MNYGALLRSKRTECGLLQEEVAKKMGVSQRTISSWETGRTIPDLDTYDKLSKIFGCTINELTGQGTDLSSLTVMDILVKLPDLDIEDLEEIQEHIERTICEKDKIRQLEKEKDEMKKRLAAYEAEIMRLKRGDK